MDESVAPDDREIYFLVAEFLERTPCQAAAQALKRELLEHRLLGSEHTWTGEALPATFETLRSRYALPPGQLLRHLRSTALATGGGAAGSLLIAPPREDSTRKIAKPLVETCYELRIVKAELRALDAREAFDCGLAGPGCADASVVPIVANCAPAHALLASADAPSATNELTGDAARAEASADGAPATVGAQDATGDAEENTVLGTAPRRRHVLRETRRFELLERRAELEEQRARQMQLAHRSVGLGAAAHSSSLAHRLHARALGRRAAPVLSPAELVQARAERSKVLNGHLTFPVYCVAFDQTSQFVITGSDDKLVKVWHARYAQLVFTLRGHHGEITDLAVSPDNSVVASASIDKEVRVWNLATGRPLAVLRRHTEAVSFVRFDPLTSTLYTVADEPTMWAWRLCTGTHTSEGVEDVRAIPLVHATAHAPSRFKVKCVDVCPLGGHVVTGSDDGIGRVWRCADFDAPTAGAAVEPVCELHGHPRAVTDVVYSHAGDRVLTASMADGTSRIWSWGPGHSRPRHLVLQASNETIVADGDSAAPGALAARLSPAEQRPGVRRARRGGQAQFKSVVWSADDQLVITSQSGKRQGGGGEAYDAQQCLKVWHSTSGALLRMIHAHSDECHGLRAHPHDSAVVMSAGYDGRVRLWNVGAGPSDGDAAVPLRSFENIPRPHEGAREGEYTPGERVPVCDCVFAPDGWSFATADMKGRLTLHGMADEHVRLAAKPSEQYFSTDYSELVWDLHGNVVDASTQLPVHLSPRGDLTDSELAAHAPQPRALRGPLPLSHDELAEMRAQLRRCAGALDFLASRNMDIADRLRRTAIHSRQPSSAASAAMPARPPLGEGRRPQPPVFEPDADEDENEWDDEHDDDDDDYDDYAAAVNGQDGGGDDDDDDDGLASDEDMEGATMARHRVLRSRRAGSRRDHSRHGRLRQRRRAVIDRDSGDERARRPTTRRGRAVRRAGRRLDDSESEEDAGFASDESSDAGVQRLASGDSSSSSSSTTAAAASSSIPELDGFDSAVQVPSDPAISSAPAAADDAADDGETAAATSIPALTCAFCGQGSTSAHPLPDMRVGDGHPLIFRKQRVWVHYDCAFWSPQTYHDEDAKWHNIGTELMRARHTQCAVCKHSGATIGCRETRCRKSFHWPCAVADGCHAAYSDVICRSCAARARGATPGSSLDFSVAYRSWLTSTTRDDEGTFTPQMGDRVLYFPQGHEQHLQKFPETSRPPWNQMMSAGGGRCAVVECVVSQVQFTFPTAEDFRNCLSVVCKLRLEVTGVPSSADATSGVPLTFDPPRVLRGRRPANFTVSMRKDELPDFLVLRHRYHAAARVAWSSGSRFAAMYDNPDAATGESCMQEWKGTVVDAEVLDPEQWPRSPWEMLIVRFDEGGGAGTDDAEERLSMWEVRSLDRPDDDAESPDCRPPNVSPAELAPVIERIEALMAAEYAQPFVEPVTDRHYLANIPVPMALSTLLGRARSDYYRQLSAYESDVRLLYENCLAYNEPASDIVKAAQRMQAELLGRRAAERRAGRADGAIAESDDAAVGSAEPTTRAGGALGDESRESDADDSDEGAVAAAAAAPRARAARLAARGSSKRPRSSSESSSSASSAAASAPPTTRTRRRSGPTDDPKRSSTASSDGSGSEPEFAADDDDSDEDHKPRRARARTTRASRAASGRDTTAPIARLPARRVRVRVGGELLSQAVTVPARELAVRVRVGGASCEPDGDSAEMNDAEDY